MENGVLFLLLGNTLLLYPIFKRLSRDFHVLPINNYNKRPEKSYQTIKGPEKALYCIPYMKYFLPKRNTYISLAHF